MIPELKTLIAVASHGTFAAAGNRIGLTQAAVSGHIRRLEDALGFPLFDRTGRSAVLNAAGLRTLARAEEIVARFDLLGDATRDDDLCGSLKIGAIASVQATLLARALVPFRARFPSCHVHVSPGVSLHLMGQVDAGDLDLAVLIRPSFEPPKDLAWRPLVREDYVLLVSSAVRGDDWRDVIVSHPFIQYDRGSFGGRQVESLLKNNSIRPSKWLEVDDIAAIVAVVEKGLGAAIVPLTETILPLNKGIRAIPLGPDRVCREIGLLSRRSTVSSLATAFSDYLLEEASASLMA